MEIVNKVWRKMLKLRRGRKKHSNKSHQSKKNGSEVAESSLFVFEALVQSYGSQSNQDILEVGLLDSELALCRASGLYSYECLLKSVQLPSLKKSVLCTLGPALRDTQSVDAFIFKHLDASNTILTQTMWNMFASLFESLTNLLEHAYARSSLNQDQAGLICYFGRMGHRIWEFKSLAIFRE